MFNYFKRTKRVLFVAFLVLAMILAFNLAPIQVFAATAPSLGTAGSFAVLGGSAVTNTGPSVINGDLGLSPGTAVTGFPPGIVVAPGTQHITDAVALQAQNDVTAAYIALAAQPSTADLTGQDLGGLTLTSGVYTFSTSAQLTGTLTLNAENNPYAVFIFQIGSTLTTASNSSVVVINAPPNFCNKYWQVGSSATLGTGTDFQGNILALTSITLNTGANLYGRALARNGAVTLDTNNISVPVCATLTTTQLSETSVMLGQSITDTVTVIGLSGSSPIPTGTVTFQVSIDGGTTFNAFGAVKTLNGSGNATSDAYTPLTAGTVYFRAVYGGASYFAGSQSGDSDELLIVESVAGKTTPVTTTQLSAVNITVGESVTDTATVTGAGGNSPIPTGTVAFQVSIDGGTTFNAFGAAKTLNGSGNATSDSYTPAAAGTAYFRAVYSGDADYNGSQSGNTEEPLVVNTPSTPNASTTTTLLSATNITVGESITDTVTVTGAGGNSPIPTGTVAFQVSIDGGATFNAFGAAKTLNGSGNATSDSYTPTAVGTAYFRAVYSGDANYDGSQSGNTEEPLVVAEAIPTPCPPEPCPPEPCPPEPCPPEPCPPTTYPTGNVTGTVASAPGPSGGTNEYNLFLNISGQQCWVAATTTDFPTLLTVGATLTGTMDNSPGWWVFKGAATVGNVTGTVASAPGPSGGTNEYNLFFRITSTGQIVWLAATTTDFPNLLTVGAIITGNLNNAPGWWVLSK